VDSIQHRSGRSLDDFVLEGCNRQRALPPIRLGNVSPALRSTDTAATAPADASAGGFLRFVRRLHRYYDEVRLLVSVPHRLRLLAFPMRTAELIQQVTTAARHEISQVPIRSLCTLWGLRARHARTTHHTRCRRV